MGARPGPSGRLDGPTLRPVAGEVASAEDDAKAVITGPMGPLRLSRAFRVLRVAVPFSRKARGASVASSSRGPSSEGRDVRTRVVVVPGATPTTVAPSPGAARVVHAVAVGGATTPHLARHGARGGREVVQVAVTKARVGAEPADDLPASLIASGGCVNAVADRLVPS